MDLKASVGKASESMVTVPCDCRCCVLEFSKTVWEDGEVDYDVCVLDSRYDHKVNGVLGRLRRAFGVLVGRPVYFNDVFIHGDEGFEALLDKLLSLRYECGVGSER